MTEFVILQSPKSNIFPWIMFLVVLLLFQNPLNGQTKGKLSSNKQLEAKIIKKGLKYGLLNSNGDTIVDCLYDKIKKVSSFRSKERFFYYLI